MFPVSFNKAKNRARLWKPATFALILRLAEGTKTGKIFPVPAVICIMPIHIQTQQIHPAAPAKAAHR
jgi:hypothetical protein